MIMADFIGQSLGRYHILEQLGEGGMAIVYKAYDTRLERDVAVKVIRRGAFPPDHLERMLKRFEREARALGKLSHPNIIAVLDYGEYEGAPYLVMEYIPGGTLKQRLGKSIPWQEAFRLLIPVARALHYAHGQGILHRDVKPANILVTGSNDPMLTDFGIAKILETGETTTLTGTGMSIGTPEYMSPEQFKGKGVDARTDIYSLGVVLYEMVTGRKPYQADTPAAILLKQVTEPLPRPGQYARGLPEKVEKLLLKALAKDSVDRYSSMGDFAAAMESCLGTLTATVEREPLHPYRKMDGTQVTVIEPDDAATMDAPTLRADSPRPIAQPQAPGWNRYWPAFAAVVGVILLVILVQKMVAGRLPAATAAPVTSAPVIGISTSAVSLTVSYITTPSQAPTYTPGATVTQPVTSSPAPSETHVSLEPAAITPTLVDEIRDSQGVTMRLVPAGEFMMGRESYADAPPHRVYLDSFYMDATEVTNLLYQKCVDANICTPPHDLGSDSRPTYFGDTEFQYYPVINVDWYQANTFCEWRGARMPTEAEWEKAARGTDGRIFPWGDEAPDCQKVNYHPDYSKRPWYRCVGDTKPVRNYASGVSPYGLYEMTGNVNEWVADWYGETYYQNSPYNNPLGWETGQYKVFRGGSWASYPETYNRNWNKPEVWSVVIGFRCAESIP
jgi:eukaryotic-like serine/threonine-protein kinase